LDLEYGSFLKKVQPKDLRTAYILAKHLEKLLIAATKEDEDQDNKFSEEF